MSHRFRGFGPNGYGVYQIVWAVQGPVFEACDGPAERTIAPGFVDLHIHGGFGIDFMTADKAQMQQLCTMLAERGYEAFLPTTITASPQEVGQALESLPEHEMVPGFHLEGPFISFLHPGAQPPDKIMDARSEGWAEILSHPKLRIVTLAPELDGAASLIASLASRGVIVSLGHSDATYAQACQGVVEGARHVTHTFNAMRGFHHREVGLAGFAMLADEIRCELIYDRLHVSPEAAKLLVRNKRAEMLLAVSDGSMAIGMASGTSLTMWGHDCIVGDREVRLASNGALAGSCVTLLDAFQNLAEDFGPEIAIQACCVNPRAVLGMKDGPRVWLEFDGRHELVEIHRH